MVGAALSLQCRGGRRDPPPPSAVLCVCLLPEGVEEATIAATANESSLYLQRAHPADARHRDELWSHEHYTFPPRTCRLVGSVLVPA